MVTTAFCVFGYWRTGRLTSERMPSTRISRLIVVASTGLRMKMSVKFMFCARPWLPFRSLFLTRMRIGIVRRLNGVVYDHGRAVLELDLSAGDGQRSGFGSFEDG